MKLKDLTGMKFGRLTVIKRAGSYETPTGHSTPTWLCRCDCGNEKVVVGTALKNKSTKSCGCLAKEVWSKNGSKVIDKTRNKDRFNKTKIGSLKMKIPVTNKSGVKGVSWNKQKRKWVASITFQCKSFNLGYYSRIEDAIVARKKGEDKYFKPTLNKYNSK